MIAAARSGSLLLEKLEAMTCVCSVGLDMIAIPEIQLLRQSPELLLMRWLSVHSITKQLP